jgi:hypothetical protein
MTRFAGDRAPRRELTLVSISSQFVSLVTGVSPSRYLLRKIHFDMLARLPPSICRKARFTRSLPGAAAALASLGGVPRPAKLYQTLRFPFDNSAWNARSRKKV